MTTNGAIQAQHARGNGFIMWLGHDPGHYWETNTIAEKQYFLASLIEIYDKYSFGNVPTLIGFAENDMQRIEEMREGNRRARETDNLNLSIATAAQVKAVEASSTWIPDSAELRQVSLSSKASGLPTSAIPHRTIFLKGFTWKKRLNNQFADSIDLKPIES
jgi:hypothetical protein